MNLEFDLLDILNDYSQKFCNKTCMIETNYKSLSEIQVVFNENNLHHLLGLHYVTKERASKTIKKIKNGQLTINSISNHNDYRKKVHYRILGYNSLEFLLIDPQTDVCIIAKDLKNNPMNLDVIFLDSRDKNKVILLGLRRAKDSMLFYPTTLHRTDKKKYDGQRKTKINKITWI